MNPLTIVQARMTSRRLPGKTLERVGDKTILEWVLHRLSLSTTNGRVVVATSTDPTDDPIADLCATLNTQCFRGSLDDVLDRFHQAARIYDGDPIIRVTADCPLLCPILLDRMVALFAETTPEYAAVTNAPAGLTQEMFSREALTETHHDARSKHDREHVVTYILDRQSWFDCRYIDANLGASVSYTIDTLDDLERLRALHDCHGDDLFAMAATDLVRVGMLSAA